MKITKLQDELLKVIALEFPNPRAEVRYIFKRVGSIDRTIDVLELSNTYCIDIELAIMGVKGPKHNNIKIN